MHPPSPPTLPSHLKSQTRYSGRLAWLRGFLAHVSADVRELAAQLLGVVIAGAELAAAPELVVALAATAAGTSLPAAKAPRFEERDGAIRALGYVLAQCRTGQLAVPGTEQAAAFAVLCGIVDANADAVLACSAVVAQGRVALRGMPPVPEGRQLQCLPCTFVFLWSMVAFVRLCVLSWLK